MHKKILFGFLLATALSCVAGIALHGSLMEKYRTSQQLDEALHAAGAVQTGGMYAAKERAEQELENAFAHKAQARRKYVEAREQSRLLREEYGMDIANTGAIVARVEQHRETLKDFVHFVHTRPLTVAVAGPDFGIALARSLLHTSLGDITDAAMRSRAVERMGFRMMTAASQAMQLSETVPLLQENYERELSAYTDAWNTYRSARDRIEESKRITEEVQKNITALQRELARIDARLKAQLERELIEKGLLGAQPGERSDGRIRSTQLFRWPVKGRISAGYRNAAYVEYFGVPHNGTDIVVPQETPVSVAADGIVYLARDGGKYGYSYVLVGHRDGYATLYGHLSSLNVTAGQQIAAGHIVGLSGGIPGTYGAGPMTTGAHLHFEVIRNGEHVDPMGVLPQ